MTAEQGKQACARVMAHTPGPWEPRWVKFAPSDEIPDPSNKHAIDIVATQFSEDDYGKAWVGDVHLQFTNKETAWANAKLIAAAPDMLAFIKGFIERHESVGVDPSSPYYSEAIAIFDKATK